MEELVNKLAELQAELKAKEEAADAVSRDTDDMIAATKQDLIDLEDTRRMLRQPQALDIAAIGNQIDVIEKCIIDAWDGEKKTLKYPARTLSFRQTGSLRIIDDVRLMELLIEKAPIVDVVSKYIKGFKLTGVKKFVEVHNVQTGVASMEYKTTVKLELSG